VIDFQSLLADALNRASRARPNSHAGQAFRIRGVERSSEFLRISALPVREWSDEEAQAAADFLTEKLKTPGGTMRLWPHQAEALTEAALFGGVTAPLGVGKGKTILSLLLPVLLGAVRPILLLPAHLIEKTEREIVKLRIHWRLHPGLRIVSYQTLGRKNHAKLLEVYLPDVIVADEAHRLKNPKAAVTRRVTRYIVGHTDTKFFPMSGTLIKRSLRDYAHLVAWSLKEGAPVPLSWVELDRWANALDEKVSVFNRFSPGALLEFATAEERKSESPLKAARLGFGRRLRATPGIIASSRDEDVDASILVTSKAEVNPAMEPHFNRLREEWETPDGWPISDGFAAWALARQLALGFHYVWDPRPPDEWLEKRYAWNKFVREVLRTNRRDLDSEDQVAQACIHHPGWYGDTEYREWRAVRDTFKPTTVPMWHDATAVERAAHWLGERRKRLVWVEHVEFGEALSRISGASFHRGKGLDAKGRLIDDLAGESAILSIEPNLEGRNLHDWNENLVVSPPPNGLRWEQLIGRTHRYPQEADEVHVTFWTLCLEHHTAITQAIRDCRLTEDTFGSEQKLLLADLTITEDHEILSLASHAAAFRSNVEREKD